MSNATDKKLELRVTRIAGEAPSEPMSATFGPEGGSIGRRRENDWVLPDPERFISGQHALISFSDGQFYITDTSVNGVFLNQSTIPLDKGELTPLREGDSLLIGDFEIGVFTQQSQTAALMRPDEFDDPFAGISQEIEGSDLGSTFPNATHSSGQIEQPDTFELESVEPEPPMPGEQAPLTPSPEKSLPPESDHVSSLEEVFQQTAPIPEDWDETTGIGIGIVDDNKSAGSQPEIFPDLELQPSKPPTPQRSPPVTVPEQPPAIAASKPTSVPQATPVTAPDSAGTEQQILRAALARGLGLPENRLGDTALPELLENLGRVTRTSLEGTMAILRARAEMKGEFRMSQTMIKPVENNPLKFSISIDEALPHIVNPTSDGGYLAPLRSVFEANEDIEAHMLAVMAGMQAALHVVLKRFKPEVLEKRLGKSAILRNLPLYKHAKTWDLFTELYSEIAHEAEDDFHLLFGETFSQAYEEQIRRIELLKRGSPDSR